MKLKIIFALSFWIALVSISCNNDDINFESPSQALRFSTDTVFCDTVFHQFRSETYAVKVYNDENKDILIPSIKLEKGAASLYKINVDGVAGHEFTNVPLRKKDSLYIFVEIAPFASGPEIIAEDKVLFNAGTGQQQITLFSVVQDAEFFIENGSNSNIISTNTNWSNNKAKVIFGNLTIDPNITLDIQPGTKIYFHKNSGMNVKSGATINMNGSLGNEITIRGDRHETYYDTIPKNWNSIKLAENTTLNMNYTRLFGGTRGLEMTESTANIKNSIIHTFQEYGIHAVHSNINAENLVTNNCGIATVGAYYGGVYKFLHSTLANYSDTMPSWQRLGLFATTDWIDPITGASDSNHITLWIHNSIIYSDKNNAVNLECQPSIINLQIHNSLLKYSNTSEAGFDFDLAYVSNCIKNEDPKFVKTFIHGMNLRVKSDSPAKNIGSLTYAALSPFDLDGISRTASPTSGAYQ